MERINNRINHQNNIINNRELYEVERVRFLNRIRVNPTLLQNAPYAIINDYDFMLEMIITRKQLNALMYASSELRGNSEFIISIIKGIRNFFQRADRYDFVMQQMTSELCRNHEFMLHVIIVLHRHEAIKYASPILLRNHDFMYACVRKYFILFKFASEELKNDRYFIMALLQINVDILKYASEEMMSDPEINLYATRINYNAFVPHDNVYDKISNDIINNHIAIDEQLNVHVGYIISYNIKKHKIYVMTPYDRYKLTEISPDTTINEISYRIYNEIHKEINKSEVFFLSYENNKISPFEGKKQIKSYIIRSQINTSNSNNISNHNNL